MDALEREAMWPGGEQAIASILKRGKQPVRDLIRKLLDEGTEFYELAHLVGFALDYPDVGEVPCGGIVTGIGRFT
ncbi:MAG: hypothetical protein AB9873_05510 [Syntrophobacteraceae bacterium]